MEQYKVVQIEYDEKAGMCKEWEIVSVDRNTGREMLMKEEYPMYCYCPTLINTEWQGDTIYNKKYWKEKQMEEL